MADRPSLVKMAVTADIPDIKDTMSRDEIDQRLNQSNSKSNLDNAPKKKTFKITSVKLNDTTDADSMDDLDESHTEMTEDYSSEILDTSRATDYGQETPSAVEEIPLNVQTMRMVNQGGDTKEKSGTDMHSRFRVVKIETKEPFHRGRWVCQDFLDPQPPVNTDKSDTKVYEDANSGSSSAGSSIHYIHGVDDPAKNPLLAGATGTVYTPMQVPEGQVSGAQDSFQPIHPAPNTAVNQPSMSNNPHSQVTSQGYFSDTSQGQAAKPILCQTINQSHSNKSINSVASTDNVQNKSQPTASGQATQGDGHSGNLQHSSQIISGTIIEKDNSNVGGHQQSGVFMPHYSTGHTGQGLPCSSMSIQSVYPPNIQTTSHIGGVSETTTLAQPSSVSNQGGQASNTYQTYVHLGDQQITNTGISQSGHSESVPSTVANSELQHTLNFPQSSSDTERTNKLDLTPGQTSYYSRTDPLKGALAAAVGSDLQVPQEEDQSGSSTVAIDNKIEQAMDLVKSHLMFAVREEVEVLKEQISELIEQNKQLEYENNILKAAASSETLAKLAQPRQQPPSSSS